MFNRRQFIGTIPASALAIGTFDSSAQALGQDGTTAASEKSVSLIASPPVVQNPRSDGFGVSIAVSGLATAWVEYGFDAADMRFTAIASHHGLVTADAGAIHVRVNHEEAFPAGQPIYYRVMVQPLRYVNAYKLERGEPEATGVFELRLPSSSAKSLRVVSINDTHENLPTIKRLHQQIEELSPNLLIWNGDTCNDFDSRDSPAQILLNPAQDVSKGWASTRPLLFSNGNHDIRGERAREVVKSFAGCPESIDLPYNQALRFGPLAIVTLDTGEDKPDNHPVFAGTAAYEPYRERQAKWLASVVADEAVASAPFKIATTHIPLRGLPGKNDGTTLSGYAHHSGFGAKLWLPTLKAAKFQAVLSGHTHSHRIDDTTAEMPVCQFVGGGPKLSQATLTIIDATQDGDSASLKIRIADVDGKTLHKKTWSVE